MKKLKVALVLLYYDFPQVFIGSDEVDARYLCMVTDDGDAGPNFACIPVSARKIQSLTNGTLDMRQAFMEPEIRELYTANFSREDDPHLVMLRAPTDLLSVDFLPEAGLIFDNYDEVSVAAAEMNATVSFVSLEVPEAEQSARIKSTTLAEFLFIFQAMLRNFGRKAARMAKKPLKRGDDSTSADVFGFAMGSFTIKFRSSYPSDMLGESPTFSVAMEQFNKFLGVAHDPLLAMAFLQSVRGHTASSLIKMMTFLLENSAPIRVEWASPSMISSQRARMPLDSIRTLVELCHQRGDLTVEELVIKGRVSKADITTASWKIHSEDDDEVYAGEIAPGAGINLSGIIITNARYEFTCQELVEAIPATGHERRRLLLTAFKEL